MGNTFLGKPPENVVIWIKAHSGPDLSKPLCFTAIDAGATIALKCVGNNLKSATFQTSVDGNTWSDYIYDTNITLANAGDKVYFRAKDDNTSIERFYSNYLQFTTSQSAKMVDVSGNVMSLLAPEFKDLKDLSTIRSGNAGYEFYRLFQSCNNIKTCKDLVLPATTLARWCYSFMFSGCTSLTQAPELPATTLVDYCYAHMFQDCTSLTTAPSVLPATTLVQWCYSYMFQDCTSLTQAPELPATTLAYHCYQYMFRDCTSLTQAPELPATTLANYCYAYMFRDCTSLTQAPELPATTLGIMCYQHMFYNAGKLNQITINQSTSTVKYHVIGWGIGVPNKQLVIITCNNGFIILNDKSSSSDDKS